MHETHAAANFILQQLLAVSLFLILEMISDVSQVTYDPSIVIHATVSNPVS